MKKLAALLLIAGCRAAPPAAIATEGVPPIPKEITERLAPYLDVRGASFEDWGPDGSLLISTRSGNTTQLHLVREPGGKREQITRSEEPVTNGIVVPATGDILFSQGRGGDENYQIHRLNLKTRETTLLTDGRSRNLMGPLNRGGDKLLFSSNRRNGRDMDLCLLDVKTGATETLLETKGEFFVGGDWSPDDSQLALLRYVSANESTPTILDVKTRARREIPAPGGVTAAHGAPRFTVDGRGVYLSSDARGEFKEIALVKIEDMSFRWGGEERWDVADIEVSGDRVAVARNEDGASALTLQIEGVAERVELPLGVLSGLKFSPDGKRLGFTLSRADAPADVYTYDIARRELVCWNCATAGSLDLATCVVPQRFSYKSFDGRDIPACVYLPRNARKAPVVISIHGGPEGQFRPSFSSLHQFWSGELGLAVIAPNVRGSSGYGKTYVALDNAEKREDAVRDIGALLDWIAKQPELDASRVAVEGGSYGGYMVLASLVHYGDRLRAGVDVVGIANFTTFLEKTSGYRVDLRRVEYGDERKPEMRSFFEKISPANHAGRIKSALLVAHGRNDPRVPFFEAEQIAGKVRARGVPVWTVYAANEGHGFARKENRDYLAAATAHFFKTFLIEGERPPQ